MGKRERRTLYWTLSYRIRHLLRLLQALQLGRAAAERLRVFSNASQNKPMSKKNSFPVTAVLLSWEHHRQAILGCHWTAKTESGGIYSPRSVYPWQTSTSWVKIHRMPLRSLRFSKHPYWIQKRVCAVQPTKRLMVHITSLTRNVYTLYEKFLSSSFSALDSLERARLSSSSRGLMDACCFVFYFL